MKKILLLGLLMSTAPLCAQNIMVLGVGTANKLQTMPSMIKDSIQIDVSEVLARYRFRRSQDLKKEDEWCDILLHIGAQKIKQNDLSAYYGNMLYTHRKLDDKFSESLKAAGGASSNIFAEIICDRVDNEMHVVCGDFFYANKMKTYTQPVPSIQWKLEDDRKVILGYECRKAVADFGGRTWAVWYAPEIPIAFGPWKLNGLPGLILTATDGVDYSFECLSISKDKQPIFKYIYESLQNIQTLQNYLKYESQCYNHPYQTFANGESAIVMAKNADGKVIRLDDTWVIPYNPIELE